MNRRDFIKLMASASVAATFDWEKMLWVPGAKQIFIPTPKQIEVFGSGARVINANSVIRSLFVIDQDGVYRYINDLNMYKRVMHKVGDIANLPKLVPKGLITDED